MFTELAFQILQADRVCKPGFVFGLILRKVLVVNVVSKVQGEICVALGWRETLEVKSTFGED